MIYLILLLSLLLRLFKLNQSLWLDEAVQAITAQNSFSYIFSEIIGDFHPPLYHFFLFFWTRIFGFTEIALRMPSVLFGVGTVFLVYKLGKLVKLDKLGIIASLFLATAPFHIYYSQEARMYSMATFFVAGSFYFFLKALKDYRGWLKKGKWNTLGYFFFTLLALYTDYYAFFILLAQILFILIKKRFKFLLLASCCLLLYLPWLPVLYKQLQFGLLATSILPEWGRLVNLSFVKALPLTFIKFSIGRISIFNKTIYAFVAVLLGLFYGGLFLQGIRGWINEKVKVNKEDNLVIYLWFLIPLASALIISIFIPNFQPFRLLLILPAFYLLLSIGITKTGTSLIYIVEVLMVIVINLSSLGVYFFNPYFQREDWRGVVNYLQQQREISVILPSETSAWPLRYYDPDNKINFISTGMGVNRIDSYQLSVISGQLLVSDKIYYIRYLVPLFDSEEKILREIEKNNYSKIKEVSYNQIPVWEFERTKIH